MIAVVRVLPLCLVAGLAAQTMVPVMPAWRAGSGRALNSLSTRRST